ncbi:MAG: acyltransferase [Kiritimatiellia bacterium]
MKRPGFDKWEKPVIEDGKPTKWNWVVRHPAKFKMGQYVDIGAFTYINADKGVTLEDDVQIGAHCAIYSVSTIDGKEGPVVLKKDSKVGAHSVVMPGVTIGENAVVGAMSFVNKDVPAGATAYGVPAVVR